MSLFDYVSEGNLKKVKELIEKGADVNARDQNGDFLLNDAVGKENLKVIEFLIEKGAKVNEKNEDGTSVLLNAVLFQNFDVIKLLIDKGADVNARAHGGFVLNDAVRQQNLKIIKLLIENGADVKAKNVDDESSVLHTAVRFYKNLDIISLLIDKGADVNATDKNGDSVLYKALVSKKPFIIRVIKLLIDKGANVNATDKEILKRDYPMTYYSLFPEEKERASQAEEEEVSRSSPPFTKFIEIPSNVTMDEKWNSIKSQYRQKSLKLHPDKGGDAEDFKALGAEYANIKQYMASMHPDHKDKFYGGKNKRATKKKLRNNKKRRVKSTRR